MHNFSHHLPRCQLSDATVIKFQQAAKERFLFFFNLPKILFICCQFDASTLSTRSPRWQRSELRLKPRIRKLCNLALWQRCWIRRQIQHNTYIWSCIKVLSFTFPWDWQLNKTVTQSVALSVHGVHTSRNRMSEEICICFKYHERLQRSCWHLCLTVCFFAALYICNNSSRFSLKGECWRWRRWPLRKAFDWRQPKESNIYQSEMPGLKPWPQNVIYQIISDIKKDSWD